MVLVKSQSLGVTVLFKAPANGEVKKFPVMDGFFHSLGGDGEQGLIFGKISGKVIFDIGDKDDGILLTRGQKFRSNLVPVK
jgi:hypothetical protein